MANPDTPIETFINAQGFTAFETDYFWSEDWNGAHRFPHYDRERWIRHADNELSDAEKAILAIDAIEGSLSHVRYKIALSHVSDDAEWSGPLRLVEVSRFNLGPTLFKSIRQAYEGVFTPSDADIERDPHVTWRFVFVTNQGQSAEPIAVSRRQVSDAEARAKMCFALSCLDLADPVGEDWSWNDIAVDETAFPRSYEMVAANGLTVPARIASLLKVGRDVRSDYEMVISSNVAGQDDTANGIVRYNMFFVDEQTSDWMVRQEVGGGPPFWGQIRTARMAGDQVWGMPYGFDPGPIEWTEVQTEGLDAWRVTLEFADGTGAPIRYRSVLNREVATYISDHWMYFGLAEFPGFVYARDAVAGTSLPLLERRAEPQRRTELVRLPNLITATGRTIPFAEHEAVEFSFVFSQPDSASSTYLAWTGTFWAVRGFPAASGWYGLPGSPFAGRSAQFAGLWQALGWDIYDRGLIVRADITLQDGLVESDLRPVIAGSSDAATLNGKGWGRQTITMRVSELAPEATGALSRTFPDLVAIGRNAWRYDLPPQTVGILERY